MRLLITAGMNDCAIARQTGIPRNTVWEWRRRPRFRPRPTSSSACGVIHDFPAIAAGPYCYVLGLYFGDGCISRMGRVWRLRIPLDQKYPGIIHACRDAIDALMPRQRASIEPQPKGCVVVSLYSKHWPCPPAAARPRQEAHQAHPSGALAANPRKGGDRRIHPRPHSQRRLPRCRERSRSQKRPLPLLEQIRRHPRPVHLRTRRTRDSLDSPEQVRHRGPP